LSIHNSCILDIVMFNGKFIALTSAGCRFL
jgi:hypothetical protein